MSARCIGSIVIAVLIASSVGIAGCGNTSSGGMCSGAGGVDTASNVAFGIAVCADCMRSNCCAELTACAGDSSCVTCAQDPTSTEPACVNDPSFGDPSSTFNAGVRACQAAACGCSAPGSPCCGTGMTTCTPGDCAPSCAGYPSC